MSAARTVGELLASLLGSCKQSPAAPTRSPGVRRTRLAVPKRHDCVPAARVAVHPAACEGWAPTRRPSVSILA
jgi:hypothetical protein